jgi:predicted S18 family serine protease
MNKALTKAQAKVAATKRAAAAKARAKDKRGWAKVIKDAESVMRLAGIKI